MLHQLLKAMLHGVQEGTELPDWAHHHLSINNQFAEAKRTKPRLPFHESPTVHGRHFQL
jgi:hypothetical protein